MNTAKPTPRPPITPANPRSPTEPTRRRAHVVDRPKPLTAEEKRDLAEIYGLEESELVDFLYDLCKRGNKI